MDAALSARLKSASTVGKEIEKRIVFDVTDGADSIGIKERAGVETYPLKPLSELYGEGLGPSVNPNDEAYLPLLLCIEEAIILYDVRCQRLTDATVSLALQQLSQDPDSPPTDPLIHAIQKSLRLHLSLNDYSRQEVRQAVRKIAKSVQRHTSDTRGYLRFIHEYLGDKQ